MHVRIALVPYLNIKKFKNIDVVKVRRKCPNHPKTDVKEFKFCPTCGTEIISQDYTERKILTPNAVLIENDFEDELWTIEYLEGVLIPNERAPSHFRIDAEGSSGQFNLLDPVYQRAMVEQIEWFKRKYEKQIMVLNQTFGEENVEVCWGMIHYWS